MPGTANHDLIGTSIVDNVFGIGGLTIQSGAPVLMNRPALVTDASALTVSGDDIILGLTAGGIVVKDLGTDDMLLEKVGGNENIEMQFQAEWDHSLAIKGFTWDVQNGGANPSDAALTTSSNWDKVVNDIKNTAGVGLRVVQAS
jgi:hypothetical protein